MDKKTFYTEIRNSLFGRQLTPQNVDNMEELLKYWDLHYRSNDVRHLCYALATVFHETDGTMRLDIVEYGKGKGKVYGRPSKNGKTYYGRGPVQITWDYNYAKLSAVVGKDLVKDPDIVLRDKQVACASVFYGMMMGIYTGKKLSDYFNVQADDPINARRIINGTDKARQIAGYYTKFMDAIECATKDPATMDVTTPVSLLSPEDSPVDEGKPLVESKTIWGAVTSGGGGVAALLSAFSGIDLNVWIAGVLALAILGGVFLVYTGRIDLRYKTGV